VKIINWLEQIDRDILLFINGHHSSFWDSVMWFASSISGWFPLYALIIIVLILKFKKQSWWLLILILPLILLSDQLSSSVIRPLVMRPRPSHTPGLEDLLHYVNNYRGGDYGFVSAHTFNVFSVSFYLFFTTRKEIKWLPYLLFPWACLVAYSRLYLGVHYPSDEVVPFLLSIFLAYGMSRIYFYVKNDYHYQI